MPRRPSNSRIASLTAALAAGALAAFALRPGPRTTGTATSAGTQVAEVRTQVIRRTIHVVHHERPPRPRTSLHRGAGPASAVGATGSAVAPRSATSGATRSAPVGSGPAPVRSRTSGSGSGSSSSPHTSGQVRTRSSGAAGGGGAGTPVRTKTSGGGGHDDGGGGHGD